MAQLSTDYPVGYETDLSPNAEKRTTVMKDHTFVIHKDSSNPVYIGTVVLIHLTPTDKTNINTFFSDPDAQWQFFNPHDGVTYDLYLTGALNFVREEREATELYVCFLPVIGEQQ